MYQFHIRANTKMGERIGLVGSSAALGGWDTEQYVPLKTDAEHYPVWFTETPIDLGAGPDEERVEYKYVLIEADGKIHYEALGDNRWAPALNVDVPDEVVITINDGEFSEIQPWPNGYIEDLDVQAPLEREPTGLNILILGSSVAAGCSAWRCRGWAWHLGLLLNKRYGHRVINRSELGANTRRTLERFPDVVPPEKPDVVILALSLGNEGLAAGTPYNSRGIQHGFEVGLRRLLRQCRELGVMPVLAGLYPNRNYTEQHGVLLHETQERMRAWDVPLLDWLDVLDNGKGGWQDGLSFDAGHPNTAGHKAMFEAIDPTVFDITRARIQAGLPKPEPSQTVFKDPTGFRVDAAPGAGGVQITNATCYAYNLTPTWDAFQAALRTQEIVQPGLYIARDRPAGASAYFSISSEHAIETEVAIPPESAMKFAPADELHAPDQAETIYYDGCLGILREADDAIRIINTTDTTYNVHPMWADVRHALKAVRQGVYQDPEEPDRDFRTMIVGSNGLESRIKAPAKSMLLLKHRYELNGYRRTAVLPLGHRCAVRMLLYKLELDGPCYPFDLVRTNYIGDVANMIEHGFEDMWNPDLLYHCSDDNRIYHRRWTGLSFGHEIEDGDDPIGNIFPVFARMARRYKLRSDRFWYSLNACDEVLFVRTGEMESSSINDLVYRLGLKCGAKPFRLLLLSPQPSSWFHLPHVVHYSMDFNPDWMYADHNYWMDCTRIMGGILNEQGVNSRNLYWCPPNPY